jgi:hypothetical protein
LGFAQVSQRGSHVKLRRESRTVIVPMHSEIAPGTLRSTLRQAGIDADEMSASIATERRHRQQSRPSACPRAAEDSRRLVVSLKYFDFDAPLSGAT